MKIFNTKYLEKKRGFALIELPVARKRVTNPERSRRGFTLIELPVARKRGFTLIELLTVIAIIGILATIIIVSYINAQAKSRDNKRRADVNSIASAHQLLYQDTRTWFIAETGQTAMPGRGFFNANVNCRSGYYPKSIATGLVEEKYIDSAPKDPKMTDDCAVPVGNFQYMVYDCEGGVKVFANLEFPTSADIQNAAQCNPPGFDMDYSAIVK